MPGSSLREIIYQIVASVPTGKVACYGQIAGLAGYPNHARYVGTTLRTLPSDSTLPWFRIINGKGEITFPVGSPSFERQAALLEAEGVRISGNRVSLKKYKWQP